MKPRPILNRKLLGCISQIDVSTVASDGISLLYAGTNEPNTYTSLVKSNGEYWQVDPNNLQEIQATKIRYFRDVDIEALSQCLESDFATFSIPISMFLLWYPDFLKKTERIIFLKKFND